MFPPPDLEAHGAPVPAKMRRRLPLFWMCHIAFTVAAIAALWWWLPFQPGCIIDVGPDSYLLGFSPDGTMLLTQGIDNPRQHWTGPIQLWSVATQQLSASFMGRGDVVVPVRWGADGKSLLAIGRDAGRLQVIDLATGRECANISGESGWIFPGGRTLGYNTGASGTTSVKLWDIPTNREIGTYGVGGPRAMSPNGKRLVTAHSLTENSEPEELLLWDVPSERLLARLSTTVPFNASATVDFSPDSQLLAIIDRQQYGPCVCLYDAATGQEVDKLPGARQAQFTGQGRTLVTLHSSAYVAFRDAASGRQLRTCQIARGLSVDNLQISPDGRVLAGQVSDTRPGFYGRWARWPWPRLAQRIYQLDLERSNRTSLRLWDAATGRELASLPAALCREFSPDGKLFATKRGNESKIRVWDVPPRRSWGLFSLLSSSLVMAMATLARWRQRPKRHRGPNPEGR
jgi:WD40 repeat protein